MSIEVRSVSTIIADMVRKVQAETPLTDFAAGSIIGTILEAAALSDFQNNVSVLKVLESSNLESLTGTDLDTKALELNIPNGIGGVGRIPARRSSGSVTVGSGFAKLSTPIYLGKPAPYSGALTLYVQNASSWPTSGQLYIGRGTLNEEGPIPYTVTVDRKTYWEIQLSPATPIIKNHGYSEQVILSKGGIRSIAAGTIVTAPATENNPQVEFSTDVAVRLLDGESEIKVGVTCTSFGEQGNVSAGSAKQFSSTPFVGATVVNSRSFANGSAAETDEALRRRIKDYPATLSKGTKTAIIASLQGIRDPVSGKSISSVSLIEPVNAGDPARCYIDDGSGLEPTLDGQNFENLLSSASGQELIFQSANYPVTACTIIGTREGPFQLTAGQTISVTLDGVTETFTVATADYANLKSVSVEEIVRGFNSQGTNIGFRTANGGTNLVVFDLTGKGEILKVSSGDLQELFGFPIVSIRPIYLYKNNKLLSFKGSTATLTTAAFPWANLAVADLANVIVEVDGVPQTISVTNNDFSTYGTSVATGSLQQWAAVFRKKISGVQLSVVGNTLVWSSWQQTSSQGSLNIYLTKDDSSAAGWVGLYKMWDPDADLISVGADSDFDFNRFSGQIKLLSKPTTGDNFTLGSTATRAETRSTESISGSFGLGLSTVGTPRLVVGFDGSFAVRALTIPSATTLIPSAISSTLVRLMSSELSPFLAVEVGDYVLLTRDTSSLVPFPTLLKGCFRVKRRGLHTSAGVDSFIELECSSARADAFLNTFTNIKCELGISTSVVKVDLLDSDYVVGQTIVIDSVSAGLASAFGGSPNLTGSRSVASVVTSGTRTVGFTFLASTTASTASGVFTCTGHLGSSAPVYEVSSDSVAAFESLGATPQVVDFGLASPLTVDELIAVANPQIVGGHFYKISPRKLSLRTNNFEKTGTVAIVAVVGTAKNIFSVATSTAIQPHVAAKTSGFVASGAPKINQLVGPTGADAYYPTQGYLKFSSTLTEILEGTPNPSIQAASSVTSYPIGLQEVEITGPNSGLYNRVYNNSSIAPYSGFISSDSSLLPAKQSGSVALRMSDLPFSPIDKLVVEMDLDEVNKTVTVPMYKQATVDTMVAIPSGSQGAQIEFTLRDQDDVTSVFTTGRPFFDHSSIYKTFDFSDFNILFRPSAIHTVYPEITDPYSSLPGGNPTNAFVLRSTQYGANHHFGFAFILPPQPNVDSINIFHKSAQQGPLVNTQVYLTIPSGNPISGSSLTGNYTITPSDYTSPSGAAIVKLTVDSPSLNTSKFKVGDAAFIGGLSLYAGTYLVIESSATPSPYVVLASPGIRKSSYTSSLLDSAINPFFCFSLKKKKISDVLTAVSTYFADNPVFTAEVTATTDVNKEVLYPSYYTNGKNTPNTGFLTIADSLDYHSVPTPFGCTAHIHTYDPDNNKITALVQYADPILPVSAQISGTGYSYVGEKCYLIPSNAKALESWMNFTAISTLSTQSEVRRVHGSENIQINSLLSGSAGAVRVTGVNANKQATTLKANPSREAGTIRCQVPFAAAQSLPRGTLVEVTNDTVTELYRSYRTVPGVNPGDSVITAANTEQADVFFRSTTTVTYSRPAPNTGLFTFKRTASGLIVGDSIAITKPTANIAKLLISGTGNLLARVGDMLVISSTSGFSSSSKCVSISSGSTLTDTYPGYPVVHVASPTEIYVIAPNIVAETVTIAATTDLMFLPMLKAEKNIRTNYKAGALFGNKINSSEALYYKIKPIGEGLVYCEFNSDSHSDLLLEGMSVCSEDYVQFADSFALPNRGKFKIVAHNGTNAMIIHNPVAVEELIHLGEVNGVLGTTYWGNGPIDDSFNSATDKRHIRIYDADSVFEGDHLRISSPASNAVSWFDSSLIGLWKITEIGINDAYEVYARVSIPNATATPYSITLGNSTGSVGFVAGSTYVGYKFVVGYTHNSSQSENADLFLYPQTQFAKFLTNNGTKFTAKHKIKYNSDTVSGIDAYKYFTQLIAEAHRVIDGSSTNSLAFPGVRASGSAVEILAPLVKSVQFNISIESKEGVSLNSIKNPAKAVVTTYVNSLGVGQEVILSEIIRRVQQVPGVKSVLINSTFPVATDGILKVGTFEVARVTKSEDITI